MVSGFKTKKIKSKKTLSEIFKDVRVKRKISLAEAEVGTKVRTRFLSAIEEGKWDTLPQSAYVRGFISAYSKFLELDTKEMLKLFDSEMLFRKKEESQKISYNQSIKETKVLITPKLIAYSSVVILVLAMFSYIVYQLFSFAGAPDLKIISPQNNIVMDSDSLNLVGVTDIDTFITVNDENVPVSSDGKFVLDLKLHRGVNVINVKAVNKAQKESSEVYTVEYKPKTANLDNSINN